MSRWKKTWFSGTLCPLNQSNYKDTETILIPAFHKVSAPCQIERAFRVSGLFVLPSGELT